METLAMSGKERRRLESFSRVRAGKLTLVKASALLRLSYRQAKRSYGRYRSEGDRGLVHRLRGRRATCGVDQVERPRGLELSGAEAVEAAIKLARYHTNRKWLIAFDGGFHGRTMGALSLTSSKVRQQERFGPFLPMVAHVPYQDVDAIESGLFKRRISPREVAAIFVEPVQGENGYIIPEPDFLPRLRALCDKHHILLVCDEIQSAMGRTGKWFAFEHFGIEPDIICMAKGLASGLPLGAVIARGDVMEGDVCGGDGGS